MDLFLNNLFSLYFKYIDNQSITKSQNAINDMWASLVIEFDLS